MIVHDIEQRSPEWYRLRLGMPTASEFGKIVTSKGEPSKQAESYAARLAGELYAESQLDDVSSEWMQRGTELEDEARKFYSFFKTTTVQEVGFVTNDAKTMGCSPDGLVGDNGSLEIKCLKPENHIAGILRWRKNKTIDPKYIPQTQGQMIITGRSWCDLVFYCPGLPPLIARQTVADGFAQALKAAVASVIEERDRIYGELNAYAPKPDTASLDVVNA